MPQLPQVAPDDSSEPQGIDVVHQILPLGQAEQERRMLAARVKWMAMELWVDIPWPGLDGAGKLVV